ncbi:MAG TPA: hypothetical protein VG778_07805, partial [Blastocatellia bacterium]|nr:hypothetical protein [Blastocatellia bacterium]
MALTTNLVQGEGMMAEIKGVLLNAWMTFLKNRYGDEAVANAMGTLDSMDRSRLSGAFLPSSWYPYDTLHTLRKLTKPLATSADRHLAAEIGAFMAEHAFTGVYKSLLERDPIKQVRKFAWIGEFFFNEARTLETEITGDTSCVVRYRYEKDATPTRAICESLGAFWRRT